MADTWTVRWAQSWASGAQLPEVARFNKFHAPAGSPAGGQFAAASGGSGKGGKDTRPVPTDQHPVGHGETGKRVSDLQSRLNALGAKPPLKTDGIFGPKTLAAVRAFQKAHGLKVDGLVGPKTTAALRGGNHPAHHHAAHHHRHPAHHRHPKKKPPAKAAPAVPPKKPNPVVPAARKPLVAPPVTRPANPPAKKKA